MAFVKKTWEDRDSEYPNRRSLTDPTTGTTEIRDIGFAEGDVFVEGDEINAENFNDLEQRIENAIDEIPITEVEVTPVVTDGETIATIRVNEDTSDIKMPKPFVVTITYASGEYTADKTIEEIYAAAENGYEVYALYGMDKFILAGYSRSSAAFINVYNTASSKTSTIRSFGFRANGTITLDSKILHNLPSISGSSSVGRIMNVISAGGENRYSLTTDNTIDDAHSSSKRTYSSQKVDAELQARDAEIALKANSADVDTALALKADKADTYTKTQVDTALSAKANSADLATVATSGDYGDLLNKPTIPTATSQLTNDSDYQTGEQISQAIANKADTDGTYEDMTVGTAMKLVATRHTTGTAPYLFRQSGGDNNAYVGTEETDKLVGASAVVNQMVNPNGTEEKTASGSVVSISDAIASPVIDLKANIVATQTGTGAKSPSNPYVIGGHTEINVTRAGKNLLDFKPFSDWSVTGSYALLRNCIPKKNLKIVFFDNDPSVDISGVYFGFADSSYISGSFQSDQYRWIISNGTVMQIKENYPANNNTSIRLDSLALYPKTEEAYNKLFSRYKVMVCPVSENPTTYEAYNGQTHTASFGQTVYGGELNVTTGVLTITHEIVDMGDINWTYLDTTSTQFFYGRKGVVKTSSTGNVVPNMLADIYKTTSTSTLRFNTNYMVSCGYAGYYEGYLLVKNLDYTDATAFKQAMTNHKICFELAEPFTVQLTPTEVNLLANNNTLYADSGDIEVKYASPITEVPTISGHKYYTRINGTTTIQASTGTAISINDRTEDNVVDLTAMFGTAIADYAYSLENATAGSGIAYLRKYGFFTKDYYPYTANTLQSVNTSKHIMVGFNQWDEQWENGYLNQNTGRMRSDTNSICSKNYMPCMPSVSYYSRWNTTATPYIYWYDENKTFISRNICKNVTITAPNSARYFKISCYNYGTTYNNDVCINISSSKNGTYEPYSKHEYALPNIDLRGLYKLDASNNLYADGDTLEGDGTLTRKYSELNLGSLSWRKDTVGGRWAFYAVVGSSYNCKVIANISDYASFISADYVVTTASLNGTYQTDKQIFQKTNDQIFITDSSYSDTDAFKTAMNGKMLQYELATPTTETATGFTNPQTVSKDGTEEYTDSRDFPLPVGHETDYPLVSEMPLPPPPVAQGSYTFKLDVDASGNQTYSWGT